MSDDFAAWLETSYKTATGSPLVVAAQRNAVSRCRRVEIVEGDLDVHYERDRMDGLIERFTYSRTTRRLLIGSKSWETLITVQPR